MKPNNKAEYKKDRQLLYARYGRIMGYPICREWAADFNTFEDWAFNNGYKRGLHLIKKDKSKPHCPENCIWVEPKVSWIWSRAKFSSKEAAAIRKEKKEGLTIKQLAKKYGVAENTIVNITAGHTYTIPHDSF